MTEYVTGSSRSRKAPQEKYRCCSNLPGLTVSPMLTADHQAMVVAEQLAKLLNAGVAAIRIDGA